jgi:hypothetical protein
MAAIRHVFAEHGCETRKEHVGCSDVLAMLEERQFSVEDAIRRLVLEADGRPQPAGLSPH